MLTAKMVAVKTTRVQRGTLISLLVIAITAAGVFMFAGRQISSWQQQLADGRVIKLEQVEFGSKHSFTYAPRWKKWLLKHAPTLANRLNVNPIWGGGSSGSGSPSLEFSLTVRDRAGRFLEEPWDHFEIVDEHGCSFGKIAGGGGGSSVAPNGLEFYVTSPATTAFPRRGRNFKLRGYLRTQATPLEFTIPNPVHEVFPVWQAESLPVTRINHDMTFTLTAIEIQRGTNGNWIPVPQIEVRNHGQLERDWYARAIAYADATGNSGEQLCLHEPVWKLNVWISRTWDAYFPPAQIWLLTNLALPEPGRVLTLNQSSTWAGVTGTAIAVAGPGTYELTNGVVGSNAPFPAGGKVTASAGMDNFGTRAISSASPHPMVFFYFSGRGDGGDLMIRGKDNTGKLFQATEWVGEPGLWLYKLAAATNATAVDLQVIVHQTYHAEFNVKPHLQIHDGRQH